MKPTHSVSSGLRLSSRLIILSGLVLLATSLFAVATASAQDASERAAIARGKLSFNVYCASCHGTEAQGEGPMTQALKAAPRDLRRIAKRNDGVFPAQKVFDQIDGTEAVLGHGSREMPVWGPTFQLQHEGGDARDVQSRIHELVAYLESIQEQRGDKPKAEPER